MARYVNGRDYKLYVLDSGEYKILACLTDCSLKISSNKIQITSRSTGLWSAFDYTTQSWSGSASGVFFIQLVSGGLTPFELTTKQINQLKPTIRFWLYDREGYGKYAYGDVVIDEMDYEGGTNDFAVFNVSFTGSGELTFEDTHSCQLIDSDGDGLVDSDGSPIIDSGCTSPDAPLGVAEFDAADFDSDDFIT